jgi:hypothetical protein
LHGVLDESESFAIEQVLQVVGGFGQRAGFKSREQRRHGAGRWQNSLAKESHERIGKEDGSRQLGL